MAFKVKKYDEKFFVSAQDYAKKWGYHRNTVYKYAREGRLLTKVICGCIKFDIRYRPLYVDM